MIFSEQQTFSDQQVITATAFSTNVIDTLATGTPARSVDALEKDLGKGTPIPILIRVTEAFNNLTTLKIGLQVDDNAGFTSQTTVIDTTVNLADLVAGKDVPWQYLPKGTDEQFIRLIYTVAGAAPTLGKITAGIVSSLEQGGIR